MDGAKILTAAEVERLTPDERQRLLNDRVITDLADVPLPFLTRARAKGEALLEARQVLNTDQP